MPNKSRASIRIETRHTLIDAEVEVTPQVLRAIGGLTAMILLSVVPIIRTSGDVMANTPRKR